MNRFSLVRTVATVVFAISFSSALANPVAPQQAFCLSEVQVVNPSVWTIELCVSKTPLAASTVTTKYYLDYQGMNPAYRPALTVQTNGYALITQQQYPGVQFHPGDTVRLRYDTTTGSAWYDSTLFLWKCVLDKNLKPTQSMAAYVWTCVWPTNPTFSYVQWLVNAAPTPGNANEAAGTYGAIRIFVCDKDSNPIPNVTIGYDCFTSIACNVRTWCTRTTDSSGCYLFPNLVSVQIQHYSVNNVGILVPDPVPGCTTTVTRMLNDYTSISTGKSTFNSQSPSTRLLNISQNHRKNSVTVAFSISGGKDDPTLSILSPSGRLLYTAKIPNTGAGTYTAVWERGARAGRYIARISGGGGTVEKAFSVR
jgi:hypothetical protein